MNDSLPFDTILETVSLLETIQDIIEEVDEFVSSLDNDVSLQDIFITVVSKNEIVAVVLDAQTLNQFVSLSGFEIISSQDVKILTSNLDSIQGDGCKHIILSTELAICGFSENAHNEVLASLLCFSGRTGSVTSSLQLTVHLFG